MNAGNKNHGTCRATVLACLVALAPTVQAAELLGKAQVPQQEFIYPDGSSYRLDRDYFGKKRDSKTPFPGPFAMPKGSGKTTYKVWPAGR